MLASADEEYKAADEAAMEAEAGGVEALEDAGSGAKEDVGRVAAELPDGTLSSVFDGREVSYVLDDRRAASEVDAASLVAATGTIVSVIIG